MLGDLKSFLTKSSVGEVGVGLTIGVAFTNLLSSVTDAVRTLLTGGGLEYGGVVSAVVALLSAALLSIVLVVKPLAKLRAMVDRDQVAAVAEAVGEGAVLTEPLAEEGSVDGLLTGRPAEAAVAVAGGTGGPVVPDGELVATADATDEAAGPPVLDGEALGPDATAPGASGARFRWHDGTTEGEQLRPVAGPGAGEALGPPDDTPATVALLDGAAGQALDELGTAGAAADAAAADDAAAAESPRPTPAAATESAKPYSQRTTKVCPYCAFDIPAIASRCGYCTADLTDAQRTAGVVLLDSP